MLFGWFLTLAIATGIGHAQNVTNSTTNSISTTTVTASNSSSATATLPTVASSTAPPFGNTTVSSTTNSTTNRTTTTFTSTIRSTTTTFVTSTTTISAVTLEPSPHPTPADHPGTYRIRGFNSHHTFHNDRNNYRSIQFTFEDIGTTPIQSTYCQVTLPISYTGSTNDYTCQDKSFAFQITRYVDSRTLDLTLNHVYPDETCTGCNDPTDEPFYGFFGQGSITITRSNMRWSSDAAAPSGTHRSYLKDDFIVFADIVVNIGKGP